MHFLALLASHHNAFWQAIPSCPKLMSSSHQSSSWIMQRRTDLAGLPLFLRRCHDERMYRGCNLICTQMPPLSTRSRSM